MKKIYSFFLLFLVCLLADSQAATTVKKSGQKNWENYIGYMQWTFDSLKVGQNDSVILLLDSATTAPFYLSSIGHAKTAIPTGYDRFPDSVKFAIQTFGEADACSFQFKYEYSLDGTNWFVPAATAAIPNDTLTTVAGPTKELLFGTARPYVPGARARITIKGTTATDTVRYQRIIAYPQFR